MKTTDFLPGTLPGWGQVTPFVLKPSHQFPLKGPPRLSSRRHASNYDEVKTIGAQNSTTRIAQQSRSALLYSRTLCNRVITLSLADNPPREGCRSEQ